MKFTPQTPPSPTFKLQKAANTTCQVPRSAFIVKFDLGKVSDNGSKNLETKESQVDQQTATFTPPLESKRILKCSPISSHIFRPLDKNMTTLLNLKKIKPTTKTITLRRKSDAERSKRVQKILCEKKSAKVSISLGPRHELPKLPSILQY